MTNATEQASNQFSESPETDLLIVSIDSTSKEDGSFYGWNLYVELNKLYRLLRVTRLDFIGDVTIHLPNGEEIWAEIILVVDRSYLKLQTADVAKLEMCEQVTPKYFLSGPLALPL